MESAFVTNVRLSKKLKRAGMPQDSQFYWNNKEGTIYHRNDVVVDMEGFGRIYTSAFLDPELDRVLPSVIQYHGAKILTCGKDVTMIYYALYDLEPGNLTDAPQKYIIKTLADTGVNSKALMVLELISRNLISV